MWVWVCLIHFNKCRNGSNIQIIKKVKWIDSGLIADNGSYNIVVRN